MSRKHRFRTTSIFVTISMSLILLLLLFAGMSFLGSKNLFNSIKEQVEFDVFLRDNISRVKIDKLISEISYNQSVKNIKFVSKDEAWAKTTKDIGQEFADEFALGNPLQNSININLHQNYVNIDSVKNFENLLMNNYSKEIEEISYSKSQFENLNSMFINFFIYLIAICIILMIISIVLINNTIRLAIFSKRFIIKTMQLVGAKHKFIRKPFMTNSIYQGITSSLIAILLYLMFSFIFAGTNNIVDKIIFTQRNVADKFVIFGITIILGILISSISTYFSMRKYLSMDIDKLYRF